MHDILWVDWETYSEIDLKKTGVYPYVDHESFRPLLLAYAWDDEPFQVHDFTVKNEIPAEIVDHLKSGGMMGSHGNFDFIIMRAMLEQKGLTLQRFQHIDTMVACAEFGLPKALQFAGEFLKCDVKKDPVGKLAISKFCKPRKIKAGGLRRMLPGEDQELWDKFVKYCRLDGELMREVYKKIPEMSSIEKELQYLDQLINDRGIQIDREACAVLLGAGEAVKVRLNEVMVEVTEGEIQTIGQVAKIAEYCNLPGAGEPMLTAALAGGKLNKKQRMVATLRLTGAKSSAAKIPKMLSNSSVDGRGRGALQFHGTVTGRWAGRLWQPHNLPRQSFKPEGVDECIAVARKGYKEFVARYPKPLDAISMCLRGMVIPQAGHELIIADYSQIEARLVAWYAGQVDILLAYKRGDDVYKQLASSVFGCPVDKVTAEQRFVGKVLVLGSGYGLGWAGLQRNLASFGVETTEDEARAYTQGFRRRFNHVPEWWLDIQRGMFAVHRQRGNVIGEIPLRGCPLKLGRQGDSIYLQLPSGKIQWFHGTDITDELTPWGTKSKVLWAKNPRGGGRYKLTHSIMAENICSGTAREILARAMLKLDHLGYSPIMSVHDEIVCEVPYGFGSDQEVEAIMCEAMPWGTGIPLAVELQRAERYCK